MAVRRRRQGSDGSPAAEKAGEPSSSPSKPEVDGREKRKRQTSTEMDHLLRQPVWIVLAMASGACAAINGVFAKLTTTALTADLAANLSALFGLARDNTYVNLTLRGTCFALNILFNILMWTLFTKALTRASSTTKVSIINVSSHFFIAAILGVLIFSEKLPALWWVGASLLVAGNVVIGKREQDEKTLLVDEESESLLMTPPPEVSEVSEVSRV